MNLHTRNISSDAAADITAHKKHDDILSILLAHAVSPGQLEIVKLLTQQYDRKQQTYVRWQYSGDAGNAEVLRYLIRNGAGVKARNKQGNTALMLAAIQGNEDDRRILLNAGADIRLRNNKREQALDLAEASGNARFLLLLDQHKPGNKWTSRWF